MQKLAEYLEITKIIYFKNHDSIELFSNLIESIPISLLKKNSDFMQFKDLINPSLTFANIFVMGKHAVEQNNTDILKFLVEDCDFKKAILTTNNDPDFKKAHFKPDEVMQVKMGLLNAACRVGAKECIQYLLSIGADPNQQDSEKRTPLHQLVTLESGDKLIDCFNGYPVNPNLRDFKERTPLHLSVLFGNLSCEDKLNKLGANPLLKFNGYTYLEMKKHHKALAVYNLQKPFVRKPTSDTDIVVNSKFALALSNPKSNENAFQTILSEKLKNSRVTAHDRTCIIIFSYILGSSPNANNIIKFLKNHLRSKTFNVAIALSMIYEACNVFVLSNEPTTVKQLCDFAYVLLQTYQFTPDQIVDKTECYRLSSFFLDKCGFFAESDSMAEKGLAVAKTNNLFKKQVDILSNLAHSQKMRMMYPQALRNFDAAHRINIAINEGSSDVTIAYHNALVVNHEYESAKKILENSTDSNKVRLTKLENDILSKDVSMEDLPESISLTEDIDEKIYVAYLKALTCTRHNKTYQALEYIKEYFSLFESEYRYDIFYSRAESISCCLALYIECQQYDPALIFLQDCEKKYPLDVSTNPYIQSLAVIVYSETNLELKAKNLIDELQTRSLDKESLKHIYLYYCAELFNNNHYDEALHYLCLATEDEEIIDVFRHMLTAKKLLTNLGDLIHPTTDTPETVFDSTEENTNDYENFDFSRIHQFFQNQKRNAVSKIIGNSHAQDKPQSTDLSWLVKGNLYKNATSVNSIFYPDYYALIDSKLFLDQKVLAQQFQLALAKGISYRKNVNGIKFLKNYVVELKIADDCRIYTTKVFKNSQGKYLIIFDKIGDHKSIKKLLRSAEPITVIETDNENASNLETKYPTRFSLTNVNNISIHDDSDENLRARKSFS